MNTARTSDNSRAIPVPAMLRKLRDANRSDEMLVRRCNDMILMIRNLTKAEADDTPSDREAAKNLRKSLADNMAWLAKWARDRAN